MKPVRISIAELTPREHRITEADLEDKLKRLGATEGAPCERTCDCMIGLVCQDRVCSSDW